MVACACVSKVARYELGGTSCRTCVCHSQRLGKAHQSMRGWVQGNNKEWTPQKQSPKRFFVSIHEVMLLAALLATPGDETIVSQDTFEA